MLSIRNLQANYGDQPVLSNINFNLQHGEMLALIGPNGSGKTSLLRCIGGVHPSWRGEITLDDQDVEEMSRRERAKQFAVVPQNAQLPPAFTVWESVALGRTPHLNWLGQLSAKDEARIDWALQAAEVNSLKDRMLGHLSGGEQQRTLLARAMAQEAPILLLDEPTAHLDLHHQISFLNLVQRLVKEKHLAVLIALHDLNLASLYAQRLILLESGRIQADGPPSEVLTTENLQAVYKAPLAVETIGEGKVPFVFVDRSNLT